LKTEILADAANLKGLFRLWVRNAGHSGVSALAGAFYG
jgi:hypothetical protein